MGWFDNLGSTLKSLTKGITGGGSAIVQSELDRAGGDVAKAADNVSSAGSVAKKIVIGAGSFASAGALGAAVSGTIQKLTGRGGVSPVSAATDLKAMDFKSMISNTVQNSMSSSGGPLQLAKNILGGGGIPNITRLLGASNPFSSITGTLGGGNNITPQVQVGGVGVSLPPVEIPGYKNPEPTKDAPRPSMSKIPVWGYVVGGIVLAALLGVGVAKKLVRAVGLKI